MNTEKARVQELENREAVRIEVEDGFAPLLAVVKACENCSGSYATVSSWYNDEILAGALLRLTVEAHPFTNEYSQGHGRRPCIYAYIQGLYKVFRMERWR
ncbi:MAG: hypothetical protein GY799_01655 [Desulfobulbaceae bacterium]|nr:hypothetical protein [Desulfobulbaceae bacterium]